MMLLKTLSDFDQYIADRLGEDRTQTDGVSRIVHHARPREFDHVTVNLTYQERRFVAWYQPLKLADSWQLPPEAFERVFDLILSLRFIYCDLATQQ